jgi:hypothetical protein
MKTNPTIIAARERKDGTRPGRAGSPLPAAERGEMFACQTALRRRARSDAPYLRLASMRSLRSISAIFVSFLFAGTAMHAQVNSGSNGSDGAFNPTTNVVINMADHSNGIYQYTSVNIPTNGSVNFIPNPNNTPVIWLVQSNCVINGNLYLYGNGGMLASGGLGGPGGFRGGNGGVTGTSGQGPGGGSVAGCGAGSASYGSVGGTFPGQAASGPTYGNVFLIPLLGGSGGGGATNYPSGGGGGGGAILIAASGTIDLNGTVSASGGASASVAGFGNAAGGGSGGAVRFLASRIGGSGQIYTSGSSGGCGIYNGSVAGTGRVRFDTYENAFSGVVQGVFTQGFQPIIIPTAGQLAQLTVTSVGGVPVSASPTGALSTPDAVLSAQQSNPISIDVHCSNIPLNTQITVSVKPANGAAVSATGFNNTGTLSSSTATVLITMPRGGGLIYATAATGN